MQLMGMSLVFLVIPKNGYEKLHSPCSDECLSNRRGKVAATAASICSPNMTMNACVHFAAIHQIAGKIFWSGPKVVD